MAQSSPRVARVDVARTRVAPRRARPSRASTMRATARATATALAHADADAGGTYAFERETTVTRVATRDDGGHEMTLASTIAHPAGGGQPSDSGRVVGANGRAWAFDAATTRRETGEVAHAGRTKPPFEVGDACRVTIDGAKRVLHARIHSAGHALDVAMIRAGLPPTTLTPTKGVHEPALAYVEYKGKVDPEHELADANALMARLNAEMAKLIAEDGASAAAEMTYDEAKAACGGELPAFIAPDMTPRIVTIVPDTPGCPCGGTHVARMSEIQDFKMTGVRVKKGVTRLSYAIPGMATW